MGDVESAFDGSDANREALDAIADFIQKVQPGSMVQKFVLLVEVIDDQDRWLSAFVAPGQKRWDSMGMLEFGLNIERNVTWEGNDDDD